MSRPTYQVAPISAYDYPSSPENRLALGEVTLALIQALDEVYGSPNMPDVGIRTWADVLIRDLYPNIPVTVWASDTVVIAPVPYDVIRKARDYVDGKLPPFVIVDKKNEGIEYLRHLTRGLPPEGTRPNEA